MANKLLRCVGCKTRFPRETMQKLLPGWFHSLDCAAKYGRAKSDRARATKAAKAKREYNQVTKELKTAQRASDKKWQTKTTQKVFNRWVVLSQLAYFKKLGITPYCISCGTEKESTQYCAGHYKTVGSHPELRFDPRNVRFQCNNRCNMQLSGNITGQQGTRGYREGIILMYGQAELDYLDGPHEMAKYTCQDLIELRAHYAKLNREIEK